MRTQADENGIHVKAYAGTTGILLAMDIEAEKRAGLLGFAVERRKEGESDKRWLMGQLHFPKVEHKPGVPVPTNVAPIQKFRWSDFAVSPGTAYEYTLHPVYGAPGRTELEPGPTVILQTAGTRQGEHAILFNRAAAASQAFSRTFPEVERILDEELQRARNEKREAHATLPPEVLQWLSRGLLEQIVGFLERGRDESWALDIAIYEYELPTIVQAVEAAQTRGVQVRIVYHAKPGDPQTAVNEQNLAAIAPASKRARLTSHICHHKFIVLSRLEKGTRLPQAVLCGSSNFTENGVYRQANVVHVVEHSDIAQDYLDLFEVLFRGDDPDATRTYITAANPIALSQPLFAGFSPRSKQTDLQAFVAAIQSARRDVLFCTVFQLDDSIANALLGHPHDAVLRYGLQNTRSQITGYHADCTADFCATAMLSTGLEGFLKETTAGQRGNILIHTKIILVDFTSDAPIVISGSHNFSYAASHWNDENFLIMRGNRDIADAYGCEVLRLYDHYRFRSRIKECGSDEKSKPLTLTEDESWTDPYFEEGSLKMADRLRFAGRQL